MRADITLLDVSLWERAQGCFTTAPFSVLLALFLFRVVEQKTFSLLFHSDLICLNQMCVNNFVCVCVRAWQHSLLFLNQLVFPWGYYCRIVSKSCPFLPLVHRVMTVIQSSYIWNARQFSWPFLASILNQQFPPDDPKAVLNEGFKVSYSLLCCLQWWTANPSHPADWNG